MNRRVRKWIPICNSAHSLNVVSSLENGSTKHTKFHWLGGSTINAQAHVAFKVWRKVAAPSMHKLTSLSKFGGRTTSTCRPAWRSTSTCTGWALPTFRERRMSYVYLSRTNYIEWISFTRLTWTRSEAAETARPRTSNGTKIAFLYMSTNQEEIRNSLMTQATPFRDEAFWFIP